MLSGMNERDRRAVTIGMWVVVPVLLFTLIGKPYWRAYTDMRDRAEQQRDMLARERRAIADTKDSPLLAQTTKQQLVRESARLFDGFDNLTATGELAEYVAEVAQESNVLLLQTETREIAPITSSLHALQLEVQAEGDIKGILQFLQKLETGPRLTRVTRLVLERKRTADASKTSKMEPLSLSASVVGFRLAGRSEAIKETIKDEIRLAGGESPFLDGELAHIDVVSAVANNPFNMMRSPPEVEYQFPDDSSLYGAIAKTAPIKLLGTVVSRDGGGFAVCDIGEGPKSIRVGQNIGIYKLKSVARGSAVFVGPNGKPLNLALPKPGVR
jgi:hypothetical protein